MVESSKIIKASEKLRVRNLGLRNQGYEFGVRKSGLGIQDSEFSVRINSGLEIYNIFLEHWRWSMVRPNHVTTQIPVKVRVNIILST